MVSCENRKCNDRKEDGCGLKLLVPDGHRKPPPHFFPPPMLPLLLPVVYHEERLSRNIPHLMNGRYRRSFTLLGASQVVLKILGVPLFSPSGMSGLDFETY